MEVLTRLLPKLAELLVGEYNLQRGVKGGIKFLQVELEHMRAALEKISKTPMDQLDKQDKLWARDVRELFYDIEDKVDIFMVHCTGSKPGKYHGFKKVLDRSLELLMQPTIRRKIATDIREIKSRVEEVGKRRDRYKIHGATDNSVTIDPRLLGELKLVTELVGIDEARDELIKILIEGDELLMKQGNIVSIVGFGGMGKTTLANAIYEKISAQFECRAFVSVSQTPDMKKLLKNMLRDLGTNINDETLGEKRLINELRQFLQEKRYIVVIDDIWDTTVWEIIRCALPHNNSGYRIIATTRNVKVAEQAGGAYNMKPLSIHNSRVLLNRRIFGKDTEKCPDEELAEVSDKILRKCAGVPLAIITITSLLANKGRNKMEWYEVHNSIGTGMENSPDAEKMRKILSYSYYDLPSNIRTCLLYLSVFPEDYEVEKDRLIFMWIAEGCIQCKEQGKSLFELGESYFNELINRSMIQPVYDDFEIGIYGCRVHDMVLDLIRSLSIEENFVTILSDTDHTSASTTVWRLSLQIDNVDHASAGSIRRMPHVRSVIAFSSAIDRMPNLRSFKVLRVLDLEDCRISEGYNLKYLKNLFHLRYLRLKNTDIDQLPEEVGNLQFLETLDIRDNYKVSCLPLTVSQLKHLLCLAVDSNIRIPNRISMLRSLEHLSWLCIDDEWKDSIEELGLLIELRVLRIDLVTDKWSDKLVDCLGKLPNIQCLEIEFIGRRNMGGLDAWVPPPHLRRLNTRRACWFSRLPAWMNNHSGLSELSIAVCELRQEGLEILGRLPTLRYLNLEVGNLGIRRTFILGAGSFPCLERCALLGFAWPVVFQLEAMPRLTRLVFDFYGEFDLALGNLPSLQYVILRPRYRPGGVPMERMEEAKAALKQAAEIHPNCPTLWFS